MRIAVPLSSVRDEPRAALDPATTKRLLGLGAEVVVAPGVGRGAHHLDDAYTEAGATLSADDADLFSADVVITLHPPTLEQIGMMKAGGILMGMLAPLANAEVIQACVEQKVSAFSMEFVPRISRAQPMDVLSSQANIGGYMAVILAAGASAKIFPMLMTAAGTIAPAKVFVIGAGVAGLQAIATAKRLGAVVEAYDVRPVVKEQIQSLGARFVELPQSKQDAEAKGGYAKEQTDEERQKQAELMAKHVIGADVVISTAALFGKAPPLLIPADVVEKMSPGSVMVDLAANAAAGRGNCESTKPGERYVTDNGVIIEGETNLPGRAPTHATQMYAANMFAFIKEIVADGALKLDLDDEVVSGALITHDGAITNEMVKGALESPAT